jgi:hypothetical protein
MKPRQLLPAPRPRPALVASLLLSGTVAIADPALAQPTTSKSPMSSSQVRYREALDAFRKGQWHDARRLLLALWSEAHSYDVAVTLVQTEYQLGHYASAARYLEFALVNIPPTEKLAAAGEYKKSLAELQQRTARVTIAVDQPSAAVSVDGEAVGSSPLDAPVYLDLGQHVLEAKLGEHQATQAVDATPGAALAVELHLSPSSPPARPADDASPQPREVADAPGPEPSTAKLVVVGAGATLAVIAAAIGAGFAVQAHGKQTDVDRLKAQARADLGDNCAAQSTLSVCADLSHAASDRNAANRAARAAFISSGVLALGTLATLVLWPESHPAGPARFTPTFDGGGVALTLLGVF